MSPEGRRVSKRNNGGCAERGHSYDFYGSPGAPASNPRRKSSLFHQLQGPWPGKLAAWRQPEVPAGLFLPLAVGPVAPSVIMYMYVPGAQASTSRRKEPTRTKQERAPLASSNLQHLTPSSPTFKLPSRSLICFLIQSQTSLQPNHQSTHNLSSSLLWLGKKPRHLVNSVSQVPSQVPAEGQRCRGHPGRVY